MELERRVRKTDLARNTHHVIQYVLTGHVVIVESHGEPEAAIVDIVDFRILSAAVKAHDRAANGPLRLDGDDEPDARASRKADTDVDNFHDQSRFDDVVGRYLSEEISLSRAAELLGVTWLELRIRFSRLGLRVRSAPIDQAEVERDVDIARSWTRDRR